MITRMKAGGVINIRHLLFTIRHKHPALLEAAKFLLFSLILIIAATRGIAGLDYKWQWYRVPKYLLIRTADGFSAGPVLQGLSVTLLISAVSLVFAVLFGFLTALFRLSRSAVASLLSRIYLEAVRNTPLLIQLFVIYFVISPILGMGRIVSAVLALSLFEGAYTSEIIRSGIISIEKGQWEAAHSIGLNTVQAYRYIILPQTFKQILPMLAGQAVSLIKDSALVSTIAIYEMTMQGQIAISESFLTFEIWFTVAAVYLIINLILSMLIRLLERRMGRAGI